MVLHGKIRKIAFLGIVLAGLIFGACSSELIQGQDDAGTGADACQADGEQLLSVLGRPIRNLHPGDQESLRVVLLEKCVGPVAGQTVDFVIQQDREGSASLDLSSVVTNEKGIAEVKLSIRDQTIISTQQFGVWAHTSADPEGIYFTIHLQPVLQQILVVGADSLSCFTEETIELSVRLTDLATQTSVRGVDLNFELANPPVGADGAIGQSKVVTSLSGIASTSFFCGTMITSYQVVVSGSSEQVEKNQFQITVKQRQGYTSEDDCPAGHSCVDGKCLPTGGDDCQSNDDCPEGYLCQDGFCRPEGSLPDSCTSSADCPTGYTCLDHVCVPCPDDNPDDCVPGDGCQSDDDCPPGFVCQNGVCVPDNPEDVVIPELGGRWQTQHTFVLEKALGGLTVTGIVDKLHQIINFCDITGIGFVDDLLCDIIDDYVPDWAQSLVEIFANLLNMLSELRAEGTMELAHMNPRELVSGTEVWDVILVRYLNACCDCNGQPGDCCNPYEQPDFPDCATIDLTRQDLQVGDVGLKVHPFTGKIRVDQSGAQPVSTLLIDPRKVEIEYGKFVGALVDLLVQIFTGYDDLEDALVDIIDCGAIQDFVDDLLGSWGPDIEAVCDAAKPMADDLLKGLLDQIGMDWKLLKFTGWATVHTQGDPPYGIRLGEVDFEKNDDGHWQGDVRIVVDSELEGSWYGER